MAMFFEKGVPPSARFAYRRDAWSGMLFAVMSGLTMPFFMVIARGNLKASPFQISVLSMMQLAPQVLSLLWASMMEGRRKMPFAVLGWIASRSLFLLAAFVTTSWSFVAMVSLFYVLETISGPAYSALMKEIYPDSDRGRIMGYARVCTLAVIPVVCLIAGPLLHGDNYRFVFPVAAMFGLASAMVFRDIPTKETHGDPSVPLHEFVKNSVRILREDRGFRWFSTGIFVCGFANIMLGPLFVLYQVDTLKVNTNWASLYVVIYSPVAMLSYIFWGSYIDRKTSNEAVAACTILLALVPVGYCFATQAWMILPISMFVAILSAGFELGYANGVLQYAPEDKIGLYQGVFNSLMGIRGLVAPFVGVALYQSGLMPMKAIFVLCAGIMLLAAAIQYHGAQTRRLIQEDANR